jgi:hypothetical protein
MAEGAAWEMHIVRPHLLRVWLAYRYVSLKKHCDRRHPPGRKVYQRGAHIIWEVDGAKDKVYTSRCPRSSTYHNIQLYCQNLSLFGKLFIDVKTLFFDCDNCVFMPGAMASTNTRISLVLYPYRRRFTTRSCSWILFKGISFATSILSSPDAHSACRRKYLMMTIILRASLFFPHISARATECS